MNSNAVSSSRGALLGAARSSASAAVEVGAAPTKRRRLRARPREELQHGRGDDAERAFRADEEVAQVVAGVVLASACAGRPRPGRRPAPPRARAQARARCRRRAPPTPPALVARLPPIWQLPSEGRLEREQPADRLGRVLRVGERHARPRRSSCRRRGSTARTRLAARATARSRRRCRSGSARRRGRYCRPAARSAMPASLRERDDRARPPRSCPAAAPAASGRDSGRATPQIGRDARSGSVIACARRRSAIKRGKQSRARRASMLRHVGRHGLASSRRGAAARRSRSLMASPRPCLGIGVTAIRRGRPHRDARRCAKRLAAASTQIAGRLRFSSRHRNARGAEGEKSLAAPGQRWRRDGCERAAHNADASMPGARGRGPGGRSGERALQDASMLSARHRPARRRIGPAAAKPTMVDSSPSVLAPPSRMRSMLSPKSAATCCAMVGAEPRRNGWREERRPARRRLDQRARDGVRGHTQRDWCQAGADQIGERRIRPARQRRG